MDAPTGLELSRRLYDAHVRQLLVRRFPDLAYAAALLGRGSEVLGFDDEMSRDHDWAARVLVLLRDGDAESRAAAVTAALQDELPAELDGHPTAVPVHSLAGYLGERLGVGPNDTWSATDWLSFPERELAMLTGGEVFHDDVGLRALRDRLAWYPHDLWLYLLASAWWRLHPEANLVGRAGQAGDELGSAVLAARVVRDLMRLCFLMERRYPPYDKWFGTAFSRLDCSPSMRPSLHAVLAARTWPERQDALANAYRLAFDRFNALRVTARVDVREKQLWDRPFPVVWGDVIEALHAAIRDPEVRVLVDRWPLGGIDRVRDLFWSATDRRAMLAGLG